MVIEPAAGVVVVALATGEYVPAAFSAAFLGGVRLDVVVRDGRPRVVGLDIRGDVGPNGERDEITTATLRGIKLAGMLHAATAAATQTREAQARFTESELAKLQTRVRRSDGRAMTDDTVRAFVREYRDTAGSVAERGKALGYSRSAVYRLLGEAVERGIITDDERRAL